MCPAQAGQARQVRSPLIYLEQNLQIHTELDHAGYSPITHRVRTRAGTMTSRASTRDRDAQQAVHQKRNPTTEAASVLEPIHLSSIGRRREGCIPIHTLTVIVHQSGWQVICSDQERSLDIPSTFSRICRVSFREEPWQY